MSGAAYVNPHKLFEDDEVDEEEIANNFRFRSNQMLPRQPSKSNLGSNSQIADMGQQRQAEDRQRRQKEIEQSTLDSSAHSILLLSECGDIGITAARELVRQRELLENTNIRLDEINKNLNYSQKHLNGIKSVFYGLKNYISGKTEKTFKSHALSSQCAGAISSKLNDTIDNVGQRTKFSDNNRYSSRPTTRFYDLDGQQATQITDSERVNQLLDANLNEMVHHITNLKHLGIAIGEEIEASTKVIDVIQDKVEGADIKIVKQNKQMNQLLGK